MWRYDLFCSPCGGFWGGQRSRGTGVGKPGLSLSLSPTCPLSTRILHDWHEAAKCSTNRPPAATHRCPNPKQHPPSYAVLRYKDHSTAPAYDVPLASTLHIQALVVRSKSGSTLWQLLVQQIRLAELFPTHLDIYVAVLPVGLLVLKVAWP